MADLSSLNWKLTFRMTLWFIYKFPVGIYLVKVNIGNTRRMCEICSELTIKTPEQLQWRRSGVFIVNFEQISHIALVPPLLTLYK